MSDSKIGQPIEVYDGPAMEEESDLIQVGVFHGFGHDVYPINEDGSEVQNVISCIVEDEDGYLDTYPVPCCKFPKVH